MTKVAVGIDIGGTNSVIGMVTEEGQIVARTSMPTVGEELFENYVKALTDKVKELLAENSEYELVAVGIGAPDANYINGNIEHASNLPWKGILPLRQLVNENLGVPVAIANDANTAALGEKLFGGAKGCDHFAEITLGTGLGSGFVIDGKLLFGHHSLAGEVGHLQLVPNGRVCGCGLRGCAETYVSATGMVRTAVEMMAEYIIDSSLRSIPVNELTSKKVYDAAKAGDKLAIMIFERTADYLAQILANTLLFSNPEKIFIFGGLANSGDLLLDPLKKAFDDKCMEMFKGTCTIELSSLPEADAAVLGSSALGWELV